MSISVGDTVKLIDKFYEHESFKSDERWIRKQIASLKGKEFKVKYISLLADRASTDKIHYTIPIELLEKVEELPKVPKPGDLFKVVGNTSPRHFFDTGDVVRFAVISDSGSYIYDRSDGRRQRVSPSDLEPFTTKHRYTADQIAEAQRIIGEIVADMAWHQQIAFALVDGNIIALSWKNRYENTKEVFEAKCSPHDEYNEAIGKMVCLCKATGRKLPDWIYV